MYNRVLSIGSLIQEALPKSANGKGALFLLTATLLFLVMSVFVKMLPHLPVEQIITFRALISMVCASLTLKKLGVPFRGNNTRDLVLRGVFGCLAMAGLFSALPLLPLATTISITYTTPVFVLIFAIPILNEKPTPMQWVFFATAIAGVVWIKGVDTSAPLAHYLLVIFSCVMGGIAHNLVRKLRITDNPHVIILYLAVIGIVVFGPFAWMKWVTPSLQDLLMLLCMGLCMHLAQYFMTIAYALAPMAEIAHYKYLGIIFAIGFGYIFFDETISASLLVGLMIIIASVYGAGRFAPSRRRNG